MTTDAKDAAGTTAAGVAGVAGRTVLLAGAGSTAGRAVARALLDAGARVALVSRSAPPAPDGAASFACDLTDTAAVDALVPRVHAVLGPVDGVLPLVGGWRGGGGVAGQTEEVYRALEPAFTALRLTTTAFWPDLLASPAGRVALVSSTSVARPTAGSAAYTALKAAAESWVASLTHGFAHVPAGPGGPAPSAGSTGGAPSGGAPSGDAPSGGAPSGGAPAQSAPPRGAAVIFRVRALAGLEEELARAVVQLWAVSASEVNGSVVDLGTDAARGE
ncbi:SDR family NAD(P)-dependent oxidoreductase [Miniimonas sp. S16]|uniref:SDR family NAD(P)-dependent oxidoreductase n=1 Tax=Miniimonas sp. S16 TaxID=2171623 RepID=UPI00272C0CD0|nr:SDR family NAD(P)-dependent oxidoreductase [Miniimonas sp. S16]